MEKQLKEKQTSPSPLPLDETSSILSSSSMMDLLGSTRQKVEELEETIISLKKENALLLSQSSMEKEETTRVKKQCGELLLRDTELQQANRQLRDKVVNEEARIADLTNAIQPPAEETEKDDLVAQILKRQTAQLRENNRQLLELLKMFSQMRRVPVRGTADVGVTSGRDV